MIRGDVLSRFYNLQENLPSEHALQPRKAGMLKGIRCSRLYSVYCLERLCASSPFSTLLLFHLLLSILWIFSKPPLSSHSYQPAAPVCSPCILRTTILYPVAPWTPSHDIRTLFPIVSMILKLEMVPTEGATPKREPLI